MRRESVFSGKPFSDLGRHFFVQTALDVIQRQQRWRALSQRSTQHSAPRLRVAQHRKLAQAKLASDACPDLRQPTRAG